MLAQRWLKTGWKYWKCKKIENYMEFANVGVMFAQNQLEILKILENKNYMEFAHVGLMLA